MSVRGSKENPDPVGPETLRVREAIALTERVKEQMKKRPPSTKEVIARMGDEAAPAGRELEGFPILTEMTSGLHGLWVIGGATGTGNSTLAMNIVANVAVPAFPVLYLDTENDTGPQARAIDDWLVSAYGADDPARDHLYVRRRLPELEADRARYFPAPALIVLDHIQNLAFGEDSGQKRASLDNVLRRCQDWVGDGYTVLVISQLNRIAYTNPPRLENFKESSAIEAAASVALGIWRPNEAAAPRVRVVKVRQQQAPLFELLLQRRGWRLTEDRRIPLKGRIAGPDETRSALSPLQKALRKVGEPAKTADIIKALKCSRRTGERMIATAATRGEIESHVRGEYVLGSSAKSSANVAEQIGGTAEETNSA